MCRPLTPFIALLVLLALAAPSAAQVTLPQETFDYDRAHPAAGLWMGNLQIDGRPRYGVFRIARGEDGAWSVKSTVGIILALGTEATEVDVDGRAVSFVVAGQAGRIRIAGEVSEDGQRLGGTVTTIPREGEPFDGALELGRTVAVMDLDKPMAFSGQIQVQQVMKLDMTIALGETPAGRWVGHVDIPAQMTRGFVIADLAREGASVTGVLPGPVPAYLELELDESERRLTGAMKQGPFTLDIDFARDDGYVGPEVNRPQHPRAPYAYAVEPVTVEHPDGHVLAGTLTTPESAASGGPPVPGVVLVSGSGPQDRDESLMGHKPFLVIAHHLTEQGIAVLRYDDRGYGESTGDFDAATTADLATDAFAAVRFLRTRPGVDPDRIGIVGHSEGGLIAPIVAGLDPDLAFIVLLAGPAVTGEEILLVQGEKVMRAEGAGEEVIAANRATQERLFALLRREQGDEALAEALRPLMEMAVAAMSPDETERASMVDAQIARLTSPWMRYFLTYDPEPALAAVRCPVLAMNGTLDLQVWHEQNLDEIERIVREAGGDVTIRRYEGLNHLFQPAKTGGVSEYATIDTTVDEQVLRDLSSWIRQKTLGPDADR